MRRLEAGIAVVVLLAACSSGSAREESTPYLVVAIDYHFHNAHPTPPLSLDQELVVLNDSVHVHNVTIEGTTFSRDVKPGERLLIDQLRSVLSSPGRYPFLCKYHIDQGMKGVIVVTSGDKRSA